MAGAIGSFVWTPRPYPQFVGRYAESLEGIGNISFTSSLNQNVKLGDLVIVSIVYADDPVSFTAPSDFVEVINSTSSGDSWAKLFISKCVTNVSAQWTVSNGSSQRWAAYTTVYNPQGFRNHPQGTLTPSDVDMVVGTTGTLNSTVTSAYNDSTIINYHFSANAGFGSQASASTADEGMVFDEGQGAFFHSNALQHGINSCHGWKETAGTVTCTHSSVRNGVTIAVAYLGPSYNTHEFTVSGDFSVPTEADAPQMLWDNTTTLDWVDWGTRNGDTVTTLISTNQDELRQNKSGVGRTESDWRGITQPKGPGTITPVLSLENMPSNFVSMDELKIVFDASDGGTKAELTDDEYSVSFRISNSGNTATLAGATSTQAANALLFNSALGWNTPVDQGLADANNGLIGKGPDHGMHFQFEYVDTTATKADWDGALLHITLNQVANMGGDNAHVGIMGVRLVAAYTADGQTGTGSATDVIDIGASIAPMPLRAVADSPTQVTLTWAAHPDAVSYDVYRDGSLISAGETGLTYVDSTVTGEVTYDYKIKPRL